MQAEIIIREVFCGTNEYDQEVDLRNRVLRVPLGMNLYEELEDESNNIHLCAFLDGGVVGTVMLIKIAEKTAKIRQVGVEESMRMRSIGRKLMEAAEERARQDGVRTLVLNARKTALGFYLKLGYETVGEEFWEVGLPHFEMKKDL